MKRDYAVKVKCPTEGMARQVALELGRLTGFEDVRRTSVGLDVEARIPNVNTLKPAIRLFLHWKEEQVKTVVYDPCGNPLFRWEP